MRPHRWLRVVAALCLALPSPAAAQSAPAPLTPDLTPPGVMFLLAPLTAFPDVIALSLVVNPRPGLTLEAGASAAAPGAFARAGLVFPVSRGVRDGTDLLVYAGYRVVTLPVEEPIVGPTVGFGIRRWVRGGWGLQVNGGLWITDRYVDCVGDCAPEGNRLVLPEIRLAGVRSRSR
ncbi:MAG TPA: hypothetical protein VE871_01000 [Longimicrobium sp.]|nr:hypothetical protein [Longimicrobium sp.]